MRWRVVKTFSTRVEAQIAQMFLESQGIEARLQADDLGGLQPQLDLTRGIGLLVDEDDVVDARRLLDPPADPF